MLTLRQATDADAATVRRLWRANPVGGPWPYYFDAPPFTKPGYRLYLIQWAGQPVGSLSLCPEPLGEHRALYVSDLVIDHSMRGQRLGNRALYRALEEHSCPAVEFLTAVFPEGNRGSRAVLARPEITIAYETPFEIFYLPALRHREPEPTTDYAQVCDLVNRFYAGHAFFVPLTPDTMARREDVTVLAQHEGGRIVACVGLWRPQKIRRLLLVNPGMALRAALWGVARANRRLNAVAQDGARELVAHVLLEPAFLPGHARAFHRLLASVGWHRDAHCYQLAAHPASRLATEGRRRLGVTFRSTFVVFQVAGQRRMLPPVREPVYHDYSLV
jgi:hypothetical protein